MNGSLDVGDRGFLQDGSEVIVRQVEDDRVCVELVEGPGILLVSGGKARRTMNFWVGSDRVSAQSKAIIRIIGQMHGDPVVSVFSGPYSYAKAMRYLKAVTNLTVSRITVNGIPTSQDGLSRLAAVQERVLKIKGAVRDSKAISS